MKKLIMALALIASTVTSYGSIDTYNFRSSMHTYSLARKCYVTTVFNGSLVINTETGYMEIMGTKKDTKEEIKLKLDTGSDFDDYALISGKKENVGATMLKFVSEDGKLELYLGGNASTKIKKSGCSACGECTSCIKLNSIKGAMIGSYECGCSNGQHYDYDFSCEIPDTKDLTKSPVWGTWNAKFKSSVD